ncbi:Asp hemolysin-like protein [Talaromyces proteolyticus]|uniref:Asp hemolysin-like protein n=1 Tax=Talaromyces proteolyticus TaxID=1131652 RepID=A0AAD4PVF1_9EURO|nr:Asp hemolysin-like protein [Talaromyces proteolyticus]KAH8690223.1 Asp hemolysin-like protein [Talaromyces proteolyticus]
MASADQQYLSILLTDDMKYDIRIENSQLQSGEFYVEGNPNDVLTTDDVDDTSVRHNGGRRSICSCGEAGSMSGTQGSLDLVDDVRDTKICTLTWRASMEPGKQNAFLTSNLNPRYQVDIGKWNRSGIMGEVPVSILEM